MKPKSSGLRNVLRLNEEYNLKFSLKSLASGTACLSKVETGILVYTYSGFKDQGTFTQGI